MDTIALTYRELAERLGVKPESARKTAQRKRWQRTTGNDGTARVHVPLDALPSPGDSHRDSPATTVQQVQIARLESELSGLRELVVAERQRASAAEADRDRWHALATRPWWKRLAG